MQGNQNKKSSKCKEIVLAFKDLIIELFSKIKGQAKP